MSWANAWPSLSSLTLPTNAARAAEARDADDGVGGRAAGVLDRRAHRVVDRLRARLVDQRHAALVHLLLAPGNRPRRGRSHRRWRCRCRERRSEVGHDELDHYWGKAGTIASIASEAIGARSDATSTTVRAEAHVACPQCRDGRRPTLRRASRLRARPRDRGAAGGRRALRRLSGRPAGTEPVSPPAVRRRAQFRLRADLAAPPGARKARAASAPGAGHARGRSGGHRRAVGRSHRSWPA